MALIMIADDDPDICDLVQFQLEQNGFEVAVANDGAKAIELARDRPPDLAILDVSMPGLSGLDVCRLLREEPTTASTRIIMLTTRIHEQDLEAGFNVGADDYLPKPFSLRELSQRVNVLIASTRR
jgi:two-component system phosphate regulon response regulator PhoB